MKGKSVKYQASKILFFLIVFVPVFLFAFYSGDNKDNGKDSVRIMFYNVENLFDTIDSNLNDDEFLPGRERHWNGYKYKQKLINVAKVIISAGTWDPPEIIGLCEIENERVVSELISNTILRDVGYKHFYAPTADIRGIGVAIMYSPDFRLISKEVIYPIYEDGDTLRTRTVLFARLSDGIDTLGCIINHWPSRRGGVTASDDKRELLSKLLAKRFLINRTSSEARLKMIIMGDFNCEPGSENLNMLVNPVNSNRDDGFRNVSNSRDSFTAGSYKYQGRWLLYDQMLINEKLRHAGGGYSYKEGSFRIIGNDFQLTDDRSFKGMKPFSTWNGPAYQGGYSDHLPVIIELVR